MRPRWFLLAAACAPEPVDTDTDTPPPGLDAAWCRAADLDDIEADLDALLPTLSIDDKASLTAGSRLLPDAAGHWSTPALPDAGFPGFRFVDGPRGVADTTGPATAFPVAVLRGATFDPDLERAVGDAIGRETRAKGANGLLAPALDVLRHPRWGRAQESYGEDPMHLGAMGTAFIHGAQDHVLAVAKHFAANVIENTRFEVDMRVEPTALHEVVYPPFRDAVTDGRVAGMMTAYNQVDGAYASQNPALLRDALKDGWRFPGFTVSDWVFGTHDTVAAATAGLDLEMPAPQIYGPALADAVRAGTVPEATLDGMVRRLLRTARCFDIAAIDPAGDPSAVGTDAHRTLARTVAERGAVLLVNDGTLPLARAGTIVVTGRLADAAPIGDNGSSAVEPTATVSLLAGLQAAAGDATIQWIEPADLASRVDDLRAADAVVVAVGTTAEDEGEGLIAAGDRADLRLPAVDRDLLAALPDRDGVVVVLHGGGAFVPEGWRPVADAALMAFFPGQEGGSALAGLLFGDVAPAGRLPATWPEAEADLPPFDNVSLSVPYDRWHGHVHLARTGVAAAFPFGWGLTYGATTLGAPRSPAPRTVEIDVTNPSDRPLRETVFAWREGADGEPLRLVGFAHAEVAPGATTALTLRLHPDAFRRWTPDTGWNDLGGPIRVRVARHAEDPGAVVDVAP